MPTKPTAIAGCDTTLFLCKKLTFQIKIYSQTRVSCSIFSKFSRENVYALQTPSNVHHSHTTLSNFTPTTTDEVQQLLSKMNKTTCKLDPFCTSIIMQHSQHFIPACICTPY